MRSVTDHLCTRGYAPRIFAGQDALDAFETGRAEGVDSLLPGQGLKSLWLLKSRIAQARAAIHSDLPAVVISDGDLPGAIAAHLEGIPSLTVGHGLIFSHTERPPVLAPWPWRREALKAGLVAWRSQRQVAVSFVPLVPKHASTTLARHALRPSLSRVQESDHLLCYFRDDNGDAILHALVNLGAKVHLFSARNPGIDGINWSPLGHKSFDAALSSARGVVSSAGSQLIAECAALGIPQFTLYESGDDEQTLNVGMLRHFKLGHGCAFNALNTDMLETFVTSLANYQRPKSLLEALPQTSLAVEEALLSLRANNG